MIWLDICDENGRTLYLDIRSIEPRQHRNKMKFALSGVLGDGLDETDVLIEIGQQVEVIFVDEWLHSGRHSDLFSRVDRDALLKVLIDRTASMSFCIESLAACAEAPRQRITEYRTEGHWHPVRPHAYREQAELPLLVSEAAA